MASDAPSSNMLSTLASNLGPLVQVVLGSVLVLVCLRFLTIWHESVKKSRSAGELGKLVKLLDFLLVGNKPDEETKSKIESQRNLSKGAASKIPQSLSIVIATVGLQASYLTWGLVQERLMTMEYAKGEKFPSANMLVFSNRVFAIIFSLIVINVFYRGENGINRAPFASFGYPSIANTLSSFAAYESLKFLSFPMSTVCKTLKIIPTMIVGTVVHKKIYSTEEYLSALVITSGAALFAAEYGAGGIDKLLGDTSHISVASALPGVLLMMTYLVVDAFTSNLQTLLFKEYLLTPYECMLGINLFSIWLSLGNLLQAGEWAISIDFLRKHPSSFVDLILLALTSASGQLFIYYTIERHGPLTFTVIQLTRQLMAILLSSWNYGHAVNARAWTGILMVFAGIYAMQVRSSAKTGKTKTS